MTTCINLIDIRISYHINLILKYKSSVIEKDFRKYDLDITHSTTYLLIVQFSFIGKALLSSNTLNLLQH